MKLNYPEIKDWVICGLPLDNWDYIAPECRRTYIHGAVYGNPKFVDGGYINTSTIQRFIYEQGIIIAETKNSKYILREENINKEYENQFGNVWEKLIKSIER